MYARKDSTDVKITDFGVSKQLIEEKLTLRGTLVGTPVYLAPILW
jgi:serine/threonine protein kinase